MTHKRRDESCEAFKETDGGFKVPTQEQKQMVWTNKDQTIQKSKDDDILQCDSSPYPSCWGGEPVPVRIILV